MWPWRPRKNSQCWLRRLHVVEEVRRSVHIVPKKSRPNALFYCNKQIMRLCHICTKRKVVHPHPVEWKLWNHDPAGSRSKSQQQIKDQELKVLVLNNKTSAEHLQPKRNTHTTSRTRTGVQSSCTLYTEGTHQNTNSMRNILLPSPDTTDIESK